MSDASTRIASEVEALASAGQKLLEGYVERVKATNAESSGKRVLIHPVEYQTWYSKALPVVQQLLPDRYEEFCSLYRDPKRRALTPESFSLHDSLVGVTPRTSRQGRMWTSDEINYRTTTLLITQVRIVEAARDRLGTALADIRGTLQAELFDDELATASGLCKGNHLRAAGSVAGVVLERHLQEVSSAHHLVIKKKNPTIADLNDPLKNAGVYDLPQWRKIQHLADLRNLCTHNKDRDPTGEEVAELISGVASIVKNVF